MTRRTQWFSVALVLLTLLSLLGTSHTTHAQAAVTVPQTIFTTQTPEVLDATDNASYELGTKFTTRVDGHIKAIRYWKAPSETPSPCVDCSQITHTGKIWTTNGSVITTAFFVNETASGWQEAKLFRPIFIQKDVVYIVTVEANSHYVATVGGAQAPITNGDLTMLADGGVYGPRGQFPTQTYQSSHYFRDVVFEPIRGQTIFTDQVPELPDATDGEAPCVGCRGKAYELGTRFTTAVDGRIIGVRYWRAASETLPRSESTDNNRGHIWSSDGRILATARFDFQWPRSGWQYAYLDTPLPVTAGETYVVSVYTNSHYAITIEGLREPVTNGNLVALANGGVYGEPGAFPTQTFRSSHYFRDVLFEPATGISVTTTSLPDAIEGENYQLGLSANGGTRPYQWSLASGELPAGLSLAPDGTLSGTPTEAGSSSVIFQVVDAAGNTAQSAAFTFTVLAPLRITTQTLPNGVVGQPYAVRLEAVGGKQPYWWDWDYQGVGPSGLSITLDGQIIGTPRTSGVFTVTISVQDQGGAIGASTDRVERTLTIMP